jgi:hypothetical protein
VLLDLLRADAGEVRLLGGTPGTRLSRSLRCAPLPGAEDRQLTLAVHARIGQHASLHL